MLWRCARAICWWETPRTPRPSGATAAPFVPEVVLVPTSGVVDDVMAGFVAVAAGAIMPGVATSISTIFSKVGSVMTLAQNQGT